MNTLDTMKLALEALERGETELRWKAITAIKEALAQPEQEPVAIDWERIAKVQNAKLMAMCDEAGGFEKLCEVMDKYEATHQPQRTKQEPVAIDWSAVHKKLELVWYRELSADEGLDEIQDLIYTHPPQRKPLTDEEIDEIWRTHLHRDSRVRAIEAAHGIKENT